MPTFALGLFLGCLATTALVAVVFMKLPQLVRAALEMVDPEGEADKHEPYEPKIESHRSTRDDLL